MAVRWRPWPLPTTSAEFAETVRVFLRDFESFNHERVEAGYLPVSADEFLANAEAEWGSLNLWEPEEGAHHA